MRTSIRLLVIAFVLLLLLGAGAWWYLFAPNAVSAAELVPSDTIAFATIPNAAKLTVGYENSQLKQVIDAPNMQPVITAIQNFIGEKNRALILAFLPNLSGQSFIALTHFDPDDLAKTGFIAGMKPKPGLNNFDAFIEKLKATYPDEIKQGTTGTGNVAGVDYQWIRGPGGADKICVAKAQGWIITSWGEASLRDWLERLQKKSATPNLALNPQYQQSLKRVGENSMTLVYLDMHAVTDILQKQTAKTNGASAAYLAKKFASAGALAIGSRFEGGEIVDHFSFLMPPQTQAEMGMGGTPCSFETLKFTGPDTRFYFATSVNWPQYWKTLQEQASLTPPNPMASTLVNFVQSLAQSQNLDIQHNIVDALGHEFSIQMEWSDDTSYPDVGIFAKVDKPDDFKPTIHAIIESTRQKYAASAVINEINVGTRNFASLKFVNPVPIIPTITEDGDYLGVFLTDNHAVRSFQRELTVGLLHNADFTRQIGDKRNGASEIVFFDTPKTLDRGYRTVQPYIALAAMFSKPIAAALKDRNLPPDLAWLAPMGTWSFVMTPDSNGMQSYSISGVGNQGFFLGAMAGGGIGALKASGYPIPGLTPAQPAPAPNLPANPPADSTNQMTQPVLPAPMPPEATTNSTPATSSEPAPATNSDITPSTPTPQPAGQ